MNNFKDMILSPRKLNFFLSFKLPSAFLCGVRALSIDEKRCKVTVRHRWINQNPFNSIFWAVQGMAAELSTGALVMLHIRNSSQPISMLVTSNKASFSKKAKGRVYFVCSEGDKVKQIVKRAIETGEGQTFWMHSIGKDQDGTVVSNFEFEWSIKLRKEPKVISGI